MMMMMNTSDMLKQFGSYLATILFFKALYEQYFPRQWQDMINTFLRRHAERLFRLISPNIRITFEEYTGTNFSRNEIYATIETYLSERTSMRASGMKASYIKHSKALVLGLADNQEVRDEFEGVNVWWTCVKKQSRSQTISFYPGMDEKRYYMLTFHGGHREVITESYLKYVLEEGKKIEIRMRQRRLYTNIKEDGCNLWSRVEFKHPATFDTLAIEPNKKQAIINDLVRFSKAKDYYAKIGKPWKRGYLLYGPPGTGKSTMISAIANFLGYDIYDLELTAVSDNTQLRRLLIDTSDKSIIVIEDIDCSLDLTGQRSKVDKAGREKKKKEENDLVAKLKNPKERKKSEVTLSGLLNFIDGIWSACGEETLIIFTTNYIEKLDPALIRRGRMDMHIELSYCGYEAFMVLARNYLDIECHPLFETIRRLLEETKMSPADVAENLMPKSLELDVDVCLKNLVGALEKAKEDAKLKEEEERQEKERSKLEAQEEEQKLDEKQEDEEENKASSNEEKTN